VRPWRFWRTLQPQQPAAMRRLLLYWLITLLGPVLMLAPYYMQICIESVATNQAQRTALSRWYASATPADRTQLAADPAALQQSLDRTYPLWNSGQLYRNCLARMMRGRDGQRAIVLGAAWVLWPWTSAAMFLVLRASMRSARLRIGHVLRVMLYSFDVALWAGLAIAMSFALAQVFEHLGANVGWMSDIVESLDTVFLTMLAIAAIRIFFACRLYLRLPHASAVAAMSQVMSFVLVTACLAHTPMFSDSILAMMNDVVRFFRRW
jgi:hypothetical protein